MSSFGAKRKARKIQTFDDDGEPTVLGSVPPLGVEGGLTSEVSPSSDPVQVPVKFGKRPLKHSSLRRSINLNDEAGLAESSSVADAPGDEKAADDRPVVIRPSGLGRSGSTKLKKRASTSRLSFGPGEGALAGDDGDSREVSTPKRSGGASLLGQRALENSAFRRSISQRLPTRPRGGEDEEEGEDGGARQRYSKEYLDELQNSTPNTPQNLASRARDEDEMELDASELEGAMVVEASELGALGGPGGASSSGGPHILTETEIQERKERRARMALEQQAVGDEASGDFISLLSDRRIGGKKGKEAGESRLVREDEDLGEGYDEFVEDGRLSLGRRAEREARRRRNQEMAEMINAAEGGGGEDGDGDSDDSEAERLAAYEAAQTRAGMDGLHHRNGGADNGSGEGYGYGEGEGGDGAVIIPRMKPLPELADCLARMQGLVQGLQDEATRRRKKIAALEREKEEILAREREVQEILDKAGQKYQAAIASAGGSVGGGVGVAAAAAAAVVTQSPLRSIPPGLGGGFAAERGLESLGTTPTRRPPDGEDVF